MVPLMDVVGEIVDCGGRTNSGNHAVNREGFGEDGERRWMDARQIANIGNKKMSYNTCSVVAGCGARRSSGLHPARQRGQRKKMEGTQRKKKPAKNKHVRIKIPFPASFNFFLNF